MIFSQYIKKSLSIVTLIGFLGGTFAPMFNVTYAAPLDVALGYSSNPTGTGILRITATYTDNIVGTPLISIDQPGTIDIIEAPMTDAGTGTIFTYDYTVNQDDGNNYIDGTAGVTLTGAYNGSGELANPPLNATFTITTIAPDTTAPVVTLNGNSVVSGEAGFGYLDQGASWTDNVDGSGSTLIGNYGDIGSFALSGSVDGNTLGSYTLEYRKVDAAGNIGAATRTVNIVDTMAPVITVSGEVNMSILLNSSFTDSGATWTDNVDGSGTIALATSGSVNTGALGTYILEYTYVDTSGNTGSTQRTVNVVNALDTTAPVVTLSGASTVNVEYGISFIDDGASWTDNVDGSGVIALATSGSVNTGALGTYILEYSYTDSAGNVGTGVTRTVNVVDTTAPVVTLSGSTPVTVTVGGSFTDDGATWTDNVDGIGFIAAYNSGSVDVNNTGSYTVGYMYVDASGNTGSVDRVINVVNIIDTTPPVIALSGASTVNVEYGTSFVDDGATWTDNVDGSGVIALATSGSVNTGSLGTYVLEYSYTDGGGNVGTGVTRTVNVVDMTAPVASIIYSTTSTTSGSVIATLTGASEVINILNNSGSSMYTFTSNGNFTFLFSDNSGNTGSTIATVTNIDRTAPVITLNGTANLTLSIGDPYIELGAMATDNIDGLISTGITLTGTVNTNTIGSYTIVYTISDSAGNVSSVSRVVNVIMATPIVTIGGGGGGGGGSAGSNSSNAINTTSSTKMDSSQSQTSSNIIDGLGLTGLQKLINTQTSSNTNVSSPSLEILPIMNSPSTTIITRDIENSIAKDSIKTLIQKGILRNSEKFEPKRFITRGEFVKILSLILGFDEEYSDYKIPFSDVDSNNDFRGYIAVGLEMGWINPNQEFFRPDDTITLGEAMKILNAAIGEGSADSPVTNNDKITRERAIILIDTSIGIN